MYLTLTLLFSTRALVLSGDVHNAVSIDVEGNLDLRNATGGRRDSHQSELTQDFVVCCHLSLPLTHLDLHLSLSVSSRGEHLKRSRGLIYTFNYFSGPKQRKS